MLQSRLTSTSVSLAATLVLIGCAGADGTDEGAIRENVIEPGITAIDDSKVLACGADAATIRTALEAFELLEGEPATDEAALVPDYLRAESDLWDIVDGELVPADPACGDMPAEVPAADIVTSTEPIDPGAAAEIEALTPDDVLATLTDDEIAEVGGRECAIEVAEVGLAFSRWQVDNPTGPLTSIRQIVDDGYLEPLELWTLTDTQLVPFDESDCIGPLDLLEPAG